MNSSNNVEAMNSTASLANDMTDATFASRARAAELTAAISRKIREEKANRPDVPEPMKFTKPRAKPTRAWKPLDLTELPEVPSDSDEMNSQSEHAYFDGLAVQHVHSGIKSDSHPLQDCPQLSNASPSLADSLDVEVGVGVTENSSTELNPKMSAESTKEQYISQASFGYTDSHQSSRPSSVMLFDATAPSFVRNEDPFLDTGFSGATDIFDEHPRYQPTSHKYSAVKGTMNDQGISHGIIANTHQHQSPRTGQIMYQEIPQYNIPNGQMQPSRNGQMMHSESPQHIMSNGQSESADFRRLSEPLPWKERPVEVVQTPTMAYPLPPRLRTPRSRIHDSVVKRVRETEKWWNSDVRPYTGNQREITNFLSNASAAHQDSVRESALEAEARRAANFPDDWSESSATTAVPEHPNARDIAYKLLVPVIANLSIYLDRKGDFGRFGKAPEWCIDKSNDGYLSYFGEDWGAPPPRVGRDPRYRPMLHEGRYTVFEDLGGRGGLGGPGRRAR